MHHKQAVAEYRYLSRHVQRRESSREAADLARGLRATVARSHELAPGERGVVDEALEKLGLSRKIALVTPRFVAVPFLVAGAAVMTTMHAGLARYFAEELGLSLSPPPVDLPRA